MCLHAGSWAEAAAFWYAWSFERGMRHWIEGGVHIGIGGWQCGWSAGDFNRGVKVADIPADQAGLTYEMARYSLLSGSGPRCFGIALAE